MDAGLQPADAGFAGAVELGVVGWREQEDDVVAIQERPDLPVDEMGAVVGLEDQRRVAHLEEGPDQF